MAESSVKKHKALRVVLITVASILIFIIVVLVGVRIYFRVPVYSYYKNSEKAFVIPELNSGMVMQGLDYNAEDGNFIISGYRTGASSLISVVEKSSGSHIKTVELKNSDGSDYTGHVGGIAVKGEYIYIANGGKYSIDIFQYNDLTAAESGESIQMLASVTFKTDNDKLKPSFVTFYDDYLVVGEFYRASNYETEASHHLEVTDGINHALAVCFRLDEAAPYGFETTPSMAFSIPDKVQGMAFDSGKVYVSTSYGLSFSHIYAFGISEAESLGEIDILGYQTEVFALDNSNLALDIKLAPMSEEIEIIDGKMYVMCEAATNKYIFGKFTSAKYCYATDLSKYSY